MKSNTHTKYHRYTKGYGTQMQVLSSKYEHTDKGDCKKSYC